MLHELARAKVNLALHVTGRRADGYHLLDSLVAFPAVGDRVSVTAADDFSLTVTGEGAAALASTPAEDNLVLKAARGMAAIAGSRAEPVAVTLEKILPVAAGVGGGSADAGATIRLVARLWSVDLSDPRVAALALALGADVPMCVASRPLRAEGIGEAITPVALPGALGILLANPRVPVPTPAVFRALAHRDNPPLPGLPPEEPAGLIAYLATVRNDLQAAAVAVEPAIARVISALEGLPRARLARMSGSGATCFALFDTEAAALAASERLAADQPGWWVRAASLS